MQVEQPDRQHLLITVEDEDELTDQAPGSTLRVRVREIAHPEAATTVDADIAYVANQDLYVASWYYDAIVRRRVNRADDPLTWLDSPGDAGYRETALAPPDATIVWTPNLPWGRAGGVRPHEGD